MHVTTPAHPHMPARVATPTGMTDDPRCGYPHRFNDDGQVVWCAMPADHHVHAGVDWAVNVVDAEED